MDTLEPKSKKKDNDFEEVNSKNNSIMKYSLIAIVAAVFVGIIFFGIKKLNSVNPVKIYENAIDSIITKVNNTFDNVEDFTSTSGKVKVELNGFLFQMSGLENIKNHELAFEAKVDRSSKNMLVGIDLIDSKNNLNGKTNFYYKDGKGYIEFKDIYDKIICLGENEEFKTSIETIFDTSDVKETTTKVSYLAKKVSDTFIKSLEEDKFNHEKTTIKVSDKEYSVNAYSYKLNGKALNEIMKKVINELLKDQTSLDYIASLSEVTTEEVKSSLEDIVNNSEAPEAEEGSLTITVYTRGIKNETVGVNLEFNVEGEKGTIKFLDVDKNIDVEMTEVFKITGSYDKGQKLDMSFYDESKKDFVNIITLTINELTDNKVNVDFQTKEIKGSTGEVEMPSVKGNITINSKKEGTKVKEDFTISAELTIEGMTSSIKLSGESESDTAPVTIDVDLTNSVDVNKVDTSTLENKLIKHYNNYEIVKSINSLSEE